MSPGPEAREPWEDEGRGQFWLGLRRANTGVVRRESLWGTASERFISSSQLGGETEPT